MTIDKIARCNTCFSLEFCNRDGFCEWCVETSEVIYSTGQFAAATPDLADETEAA